MLLLQLITGTGQAQDKLFMLYRYAPLLYNPASPAYDNDASISFLGQNYKASNVNAINYNVLDAELPFIFKSSGKRYGGLGVHFANQAAGKDKMLEQNTIGMSLAYNVEVAKRHYLSFGLRSSYNNRRTTLSSFTTGSQWIADEFRFDPNAPLGEQMAKDRASYFNMGAGLIWGYAKAGEGHSFIGVSAHNLARPNVSFYAESSTLPILYMATAGTVLYSTPRVSVSPVLFYRNDGIGQYVDGSLNTSIKFENKNPYDLIKPGSIGFQLMYGTGNGLSMSIQLDQPGLSVGFGYSVPMGRGTGQYYHSATEFGISLSKAIWKARPKKIRIGDSGQYQPVRNFDFNGQQNQGGQQEATAPGKEGHATTRPKSDIEQVQEKIAEFEEVKSLQFELVKYFNFDFGKAGLKDNAKPFLDELAQLMKDNPSFRLEVIGHTDNVGRPLDNYKLSTERAKAVSAYLVGQGVEEGRITITGKGDTDPVSTNTTEAGKEKNRRVEFIIYVDNE